MELLRWNSAVRGHHVYKDILLRVEQDDNPEDCFAVCIVKGSAGGVLRSFFFDKFPPFS